LERTTGTEPASSAWKAKAGGSLTCGDEVDTHQDQVIFETFEEIAAAGAATDRQMNAPGGHGAMLTL
jgi:hypothetical protein